MDPQLYKKVFTRILDAFEPIAYLTIAFALSVPIVMLVVSAALIMLEVAELGALGTVLAVLDRLLMAFIFVELIATIKITQTERGPLSPNRSYWWDSSLGCDVSYCSPLDLSRLKYGKGSEHGHRARAHDGLSDRPDNCALLHSSPAVV
jgi:hypothetical protein